MASMWLCWLRITRSGCSCTRSRRKRSHSRTTGETASDPCMSRYMSLKKGSLGVVAAHGARDEAGERDLRVRGESGAHCLHPALQVLDEVPVLRDLPHELDHVVRGTALVAEEDAHQRRHWTPQQWTSCCHN